MSLADIFHEKEEQQIYLEHLLQSQSWYRFLPQTYCVNSILKKTDTNG